MTGRNWILNGLAVLTLVSCVALSACGKKGRCAVCSSNSDCDSGQCTEFSDGNNKRLLCAGSSGSETCSVPQ